MRRITGSYQHTLRPNQFRRHQRLDLLDYLCYNGSARYEYLPCSIDRFEVLKRETLLAIIPAHLDPFLGFLHSPQRYKPSLVYDMMEPFRALIEDFALSYHTRLGRDSFEKHGTQHGYPSRVFLRKEEEIEMMQAVDRLLDKKIPYVRRKWTRTTKIRTVIKEEPVKLVQHLRENKMFEPFLVDC